jgi:hypothetical protein
MVWKTRGGGGIILICLKNVKFFIFSPSCSMFTIFSFHCFIALCLNTHFSFIHLCNTLTNGEFLKISGFFSHFRDYIILFQILSRKKVQIGEKCLKLRSIFVELYNEYIISILLILSIFLVVRQNFTLGIAITHYG